MSANHAGSPKRHSVPVLKVRQTRQKRSAPHLTPRDPRLDAVGSVRRVTIVAERAYLSSFSRLVSSIIGRNDFLSLSSLSNFARVRDSV